SIATGVVQPEKRTTVSVRRERIVAFTFIFMSIRN
ncbi:MAG: hypothetical protein ACI9A1_001215, partial [Lentimonas sp.]